jgi:hypothetical protein
VTGFAGKFYVHKWKTYLVDMHDWFNPVLVRKHFDNKEQAKDFKQRYCDKSYEIVTGKVALNMELRDWHNDKPKHRHPVARKSKYEFPPHIKTQRQKQIYRHNKRQRLKRKKYRPMINYKQLKEILEHKEVLFFKRLSNYTSYYKAYSEHVKDFYYIRKEYDYPYDVVNVSAIVKCLDKYYNLGPYNTVEVAIYIYEIFKERVIKWLIRPDMSHKDEEEVKAEFLARGFIKKSDSKFVNNENAFVETIFIKPTLVYPEEAYFGIEGQGMYDHQVYDLQSLVGIQGYCKARIIE